MWFCLCVSLCVSLSNAFLLTWLALLFGEILDDSGAILCPVPDSFLPQAPDSVIICPIPTFFLPHAPDSAILCPVPSSFLPQAPDSAILCPVPNSFLPQALDSGIALWGVLGASWDQKRTNINCIFLWYLLGISSSASDTYLNINSNTDINTIFPYSPLYIDLNIYIYICIHIYMYIHTYILI